MALGLWAGCQDPGEPQLVRAQAHFEALLAERVPLTDARFDAVLAELRDVPDRSKAKPRARALEERIEAARSLPARPLAGAGEGDEPLAARCAQLAQQLGHAKGPPREALAEELARCQAALERQRARGSHPH
jgi:hypothetical protein